MIEINLLPPEHRPVERTPLPRLMTWIGGVLLVSIALVAWAWLNFVEIPKKEELRKNKQAQLAKEQENARRVQAIDAEIKSFMSRVNVLQELFNQRICWSRIFDRIADTRSKIKDEDVVLTSLDMKKGTATGAGNRPTETRLLNLKGFVASQRKDADNELRQVYVKSFVNVLRNDKEFAKDFDCEKDTGAIRSTYVGDTLVTDVKATGSGSTRDLPKSMMEFEVNFQMKAPPAPAAAAPATPPATTQQPAEKK